MTVATAMTATALTAARAGLVSCETCRLLSRPAAGAGLLPALRGGAGMDLDF